MSSKQWTVLTRLSILAVLVSVVFGATAAVAGAGPERARVVDAVRVDERNIRYRVYSPAMDRVIGIDVLRPVDASTPRPTLYLLNGGGGGEDDATWRKQTDVLDFLATREINVVQPVGGRSSYYTDWRATDPALGVNKWRTFLTVELPPVMDAALRTDGRKAISGMSMSATSVLQLAIAAPGLFGSVAAYSGCARISDETGMRMVRTVVKVGGGNTDNMYGPPGDPMWIANDPYVNADRLRGTNLYLSTGSGVPGPHDVADSPFLMTPGSEGLANQVIVGGAIEVATDQCTRAMRERLDELGIAATYDFLDGTHSWGYFRDSFLRSWPVLARGLGLTG
ncbi:alpha/beta hydrolase [Nocardia pseudobrasiliensis]|uniref:S-formylglutathione hydrolase FrmB n=1 Tax=Nocardia pseudobrasiliensis TaxID=45979 RepID=A0A370IDH8_9NOCA|nr:alpha/beta hydrolase family protein [Nocardia pseudobrasiliensis]RDI68777.1 S-formylglutathione hydrolase FrmB [Nocardia pseudobrasiliensis]